MDPNTTFRWRADDDQLRSLVILRVSGPLLLSNLYFCVSRGVQDPCPHPLLIGVLDRKRKVEHTKELLKDASGMP